MDTAPHEVAEEPEPAAPPEPEPVAEPEPVEAERVSSGAEAVVPEEVEAEPVEPAAEPEVAEAPEPVVVTDAVRHEYDGGRLVAIEIEESGGVTRIERGPDGWSVHPG